ncbi:hypothetical protein GALL_395820 [mine drainage metagenome]|uniref:Uncharacterized protein n=1 Tax=mine drainage metagenome TaxID=410659 RepID=A0A1J5Q5R5_9ZZZZ
MHIAGIATAFFDTHLADGFKERQRLDVAHGSTDLDDGDFRAFGPALDVLLDFVGDVRDHLHRLAQVLAAPLLADDVFVHLAGGEIVAFLHAGADETLIMAQIEIGFGAVVGDEHLAVLKRTHGAGIDVDVRVQLEHGDFDAARFKNGAQ